MAEQRPTGLKATSGLELLTFSTANGYKISVFLEELRDAYGLDYTVQSIDIMKDIQKEPWFTALNPNGRIPVLVDHDRGGLAIFETLAILSYLARYFDPEHRFSFDPFADPVHFAQAESWIAWQHGGVGPMQGQANHFLRFGGRAQGEMYATQRYVGESERLYGVVENHLRDRDFVAGPGRGKFSIADMALIGWATGAKTSGINTSPERLPHFLAWRERCLSRPAVARGIKVPTASSFGDAQIAAAVAAGNSDVIRSEEETAAYLKAAQEKYRYKYTTP